MSYNQTLQGYQNPIYQQPAYLSTNPFATAQPQVQPYGYGNVVHHPNAGFENYPNPYNMPVQQQYEYVTVPTLYVQPQPVQIYNSTVSEGPLGQYHTVITSEVITGNDYLFLQTDALFDEISQIMRKSNKAFTTDFYGLVGQIESLNEFTNEDELIQIKTELNSLKSIINPSNSQQTQLVDLQINKIIAFEIRPQLPPQQNDVDIEAVKALSYLSLKPKEMNIDEAIACLEQVKNNLDLSTQLKDKIITAVCSRAEHITRKNNKTENEVVSALNEIELAKKLTNSTELRRRLDSLKTQLEKNQTCAIQ